MTLLRFAVWVVFCAGMLPAMIVAVIGDRRERRQEWLGSRTQRLGAWMLEKMDG